MVGNSQFGPSCGGGCDMAKGCSPQASDTQTRNLPMLSGLSGVAARPQLLTTDVLVWCMRLPLVAELWASQDSD